MAALRAKQRKASARELANRMGVSPRTIQRYMAEPRSDYEARAEARHEQIRELRSEGLSMRAIASEVGVSVGAVHYALSKTTDSAAS